MIGWLVNCLVVRVTNHDSISSEGHTLARACAIVAEMLSRNVVSNFKTLELNFLRVQFP